MSTFVICHGAWDGGWIWREPAAILRASGHVVYTPTLTGMGERAHLSRPTVNLDTHIEDVVNLILYERLRNVVLVGHNYSGMVVTGVAERIPDSIRELIYLDAFVPRNGQSLLDLYHDAPIVRDLLELTRSEGNGWRVPFPGEDPYDLRVVGQPLQTFMQPLRLSNPKALALPRTYIACTQRGDNPVYAPVAVSAQTAREAGWKYHELATGHNPNLEQPYAIATLLHSLAEPQNSDAGW